jgi:peptidoglycan/LPS O-acetylase OafA/YrhL
MNSWEAQIFDVSLLLGDCLVAATVICSLAIAKLTYDRIETPGRDLGYRLTKTPLVRPSKA